jgi:hypothetical protein
MLPKSVRKSEREAGERPPVRESERAEERESHSSQLVGRGRVSPATAVAVWQCGISVA